MVHNLAKSPLAWSIGGVGAIALALIGGSYWAPNAPSAAEPVTPNISISPWQQGTDLGWQAAVAAQSAQSRADWQQVGALWGQAIAALEAVPKDDPRYAEAQTKVADYRGNQAIAGERQAKASAAPSNPAASDLQTALSAFTFAPGDTGTVGRSADGLATVELVGNQATLVLPRRDASLTMAQVVYAQQFVALTTPEATAPWLLEGLRAAQGDRPQPLPADVPVTLSIEPETLSITATTAP